MTLMDEINATAGFWAEEENFWLEGPDFFRANMVEDVVMHFPEPTGKLTGPQILAALEKAPRWDAVTFYDRDMEKLGNKVRITYRAEARRNGFASYVARCESVYVKLGSDWLLASHKQEALDR
jgi:hypothetical protein